MLAHMSKPLIDLHITGPAGRKEKAFIALHGFGYMQKTERSPSWRDAFPSELRENEWGV